MLAFLGLPIGWTIVTGIGMLLSFLASLRVKSTFAKFAKVGLRNDMTGVDAARAVLNAKGIHDVGIERVRGALTDHYDPRARTLRLSAQVHDGRSISSVAVAAHEAGHAIQHADGYGPLMLRSRLVPITNLGSKFWIWPVILGFSMNMTGLVYVGIALFATVVLFKLVTLPTEFDASARARRLLASGGIVQSEEEEEGVAKVLNAAAMTYLAAATGATLQMLYLIWHARRRRSRR